MSPDPRVDYQTHPGEYRHWKLKFEGPVATLAADFDENAGLRPGYILYLRANAEGNRKSVEHISSHGKQSYYGNLFEAGNSRQSTAWVPSCFV